LFLAYRARDGIKRIERVETKSQWVHSQVEALTGDALREIINWVSRKKEVRHPLFLFGLRSL
jgi:hypothetical protein